VTTILFHIAQGSKIGYFGHFHFVPKEHHLQRNNEFARLHESNDPLGKFSVKEEGGKGSIPTCKGVMCKFGARWLILEVTILEKVEAKT
jgi:hypothetical protein